MDWMWGEGEGGYDEELSVLNNQVADNAIYCDEKTEGETCFGRKK